MKRATERILLLVAAVAGLGIAGVLGLSSIGCVTSDREAGPPAEDAGAAGVAPKVGTPSATSPTISPGSSSTTVPAAVPDLSSAPDRLKDGPPVFADVTESAGLDFTHPRPANAKFPLGGGVIVFDYDGDGHEDIYLSVPNGPNALYRNDGDGTFADVAVDAGVDDPGGVGNGGCAADYDNDGDQDLFVTNDGSSRLFRNNGDGTFDDVTAHTVGDANLPHRNTGCAWGDYDQDGNLDLVVVRHLWERYPTVTAPGDIFASIGGLTLYHNSGDGAMTDVTYLLGDTTISDSADSKHVDYEEPGRVGNVRGAGFQPGWVDLDNDGDLDLYVVNDFGHLIQRNVLWRNDGAAPDGSWAFVDVSAASGADVAMFGMGVAVGDYDLDGSLDLFMTNIGDNVLLKSDGDGLRFTDIALRAGVGTGSVGDADRVAWGAVFFDYDNDGDEDLYVVNGFLEVDNVVNLKVQPNVLLQNQGNGTFVDVSLGSGAADPGVGRGGVYMDFNDDGCLDLFLANYGQRAKLLRNVCDHGNNWLELRTVGTASNRDGIGARITVLAGGTSQTREVSAGSSSMSQSMLAAHFGIGKAEVAEYVLIRWPSGVVQTLIDVPANQQLTVTERE